MATRVLSGGRPFVFGAAVMFLSAALAHAAPPLLHPPLPHHVGPAIGGHFHQPGHIFYYPCYRPYYGGYGYSSAYYPSYGNADYNSTLPVPAMPAPTAEEKDRAALLAASGVPIEEGQPVWPLALRVLPGPEAQALRGRIDSLLQVAATGAASGRPSTAAVEELAQATDHLRKLLLRHREERGRLAQPTYEEATRFLDTLAGTQKLLRNR